MGSPLNPFGFSSTLSGSNALSSLVAPPVPPWFGSGLSFSSTSPLANAILGLPVGALPLSQPPPPVLRWLHVRNRFKAFIAHLAITPTQFEDGDKKQAGVRACLNRHYYGISSETANSRLIGSWGKATRVRPSRDVDMPVLSARCLTCTDAFVIFRQGKPRISEGRIPENPAR
jgi:hypothetical protein